ncbi:hypothetical protein ACFFHM_15210 [Halalkalibacter kiskunsagensis]|uniref:Uncharacterized protein n=1 Tax=Halalkalibacter kiskunsagensis TaxID=1548599 RepID=A0ABV6KEQ0_9BACI
MKKLILGFLIIVTLAFASPNTEISNPSDTIRVNSVPFEVANPSDTIRVNSTNEAY